MSPIDPSLGIASVALAVADLQRSADFYERVLGLPVLARENDRVVLGPDRARPALTLAPITDPAPAPPGSTGLFHVAWLHPSRASLAESVRRVAGEQWRFDGAADHGVSEALYLSDPDGLGIELYVDRPRELWQPGAGGRGVRMVTEALDLDGLLAEHPGAPAAAVPADTIIGHVHLKVSDVERAAAFYGGELGFEEQARLPSAAFLSAGGYHHHLGLNTWQSRGARAAPDSAPGLRLVQFELGDEVALDALERDLADGVSGARATRAEDGAVSVRDPDGQQLRFARRG